MPRVQPLLPFLRPLTAPRASASRPLLRFSTAVRLRVDQPKAPENNSPIPPSASGSIPAVPSATPSEPTPEIASTPSTPAEASRAADLAAAEAITEADSAQPPEQKPVLPSKRRRSPRSNKSSGAETVVDAFTTTLDPSISSTSSTTSKTPKQRHGPPKVELPPARYHVARSANNNLPIYSDYKRGGNLHITTVRKITGDLYALRDDLRALLKKDEDEVKINNLTQHVSVKGHHVPQIQDFLRARGM